LTIELSDVILVSIVELVGLLGLSTAAVTLLVVGVLWASISRCPECGSLATRPVGAMDQGIRVCRACFSLYRP